ncbi:MAG: transglycosylase SLT domain-containing protein, partial [Candidatus Woesearchaeota archaeon]
TFGIVGAGKDLWNQTLYQATGGDFYYTGQVDRNAEEKLGVFIEDLQGASPEFYDDEPITVWATMRARTLDKDVDIDVECYRYNPKDKPKDPRLKAPREDGIITPTDHFTIYDLEVEDLDCYFNRLDKGRQIVGFKADFNFETQAYYKTYFMDINNLRSYRRENIDVLKQFGIKDSSPVAIYTNGPLKIGMRVKEPPVGIGVFEPEGGVGESIDQNSVSLRITIDNNWDGIVKDISRLVIMIPNGMEIEADENGEYKCNEFTFEPSSCSSLSELAERCDDQINNIYSLKKITNPDGGVEDIENDVTEHLSDTEIEKFRHISCTIAIDDNEVLGNNPIIAQYFKVLLDYDYSIEEELSLNIKESGLMNDDLTGGIVNGSSTATSETKKVEFNTEISDDDYLNSYIITAGDTNRNHEEEYSEFILQQAKSNNVNYFLIKAIITAESSWDPDASGDGGGSVGLMQISQEVKNDRHCKDDYDSNPRSNIECGAKQLSYLIDFIKRNNIGITVRNTAAGYNGGLGAIEASSDCTGKLAFECEWDDPEHTISNTGYRVTREYVKRVDRYYNGIAV